MLITSDSRKVTMSPLFFTKPQFVQVPKGITIQEIVDLMYENNSVPVNKRNYKDILVEVDGISIPFDKWNRTPSVDQHVLVSFMLHGGGSGNAQKDIGRAMMMLAVVVLSIYTGGVAGAAYANAYSAGVATAMSTTVGAVTSMAVMTAGMMLVNAIVPIPKIHDPSSGGRDKDSFGITGASNSANPFGTVPVILGTHKMFPLYGSYPYTELVGNDEYLRSLFVWGYGPATITSIEIGETPVGIYENVDIETREGRSTDADITLIPETVKQTSIQVRLKSGDDAIIRKVDGDGWDELGVNIIFPSGLYQMVDNAKSKMDAIVEVWYRTEEETEWTHVPGVYPESVMEEDHTDHTFYARDKTTKPLRLGITWSVDRSKQYYLKVQKTWHEAKYEDKPNYAQYCNWEYIKTILHEQPVSFNQPLAMTGIKIKATEQLNGVISDLSGIVSSYCTVWNGSAWTGEAISNNPAALFRMVLMHPANVKARASTQIDDAGLGEWYEFCETNGYAFNQIRDSKSSVWECLTEIAAAGRASPSLVDGVWGVVIDSSDKSVVQHITPRNSWGFSSSKKLYDPPHGFRVKFKNELNDYEDDERIVLDDGYQIDGYDAFDSYAPANISATVFESVEFPGITSPELVFKFARYFMAAARLRPEVYTLNMDFEHLVCKRGDKVLVAHDVPMWGTKWGRIKSVVTAQTLINLYSAGVFYDQAGNVITWEDTDYSTWDKGDTVAKVVGIQLDEKFAITSAAQYVLRVRRSDTNESQIINLASMAVGEYDIALFETALEDDDPLVPLVGDLVIIGELTKETNECLVKAIHAENDLSAKIELVDFAEEIYDADTGEIPEFDTNITKQPELDEMIPSVPIIYSIQSGTDTMEIASVGRLAPRMFVTCGVGITSSRVGSFEVKYRLYGDIKWAYATCKSNDPTAICTDVLEEETYEVAARSVSPYGVYSEWSSIQTHKIVGQSELPDDVTRFTCNILGTEAHLSWEPVSDIDLSHYRVRWSPLTASAVWEDAIDIIAKVAKPASSVSAPAMTGSYLIKAVDYKGNESETAAIALSGVTRIPGYTNAQTLTQPAWSGTGEGAEYDAVLGGIILSYEGTGDNLIENGEDFTGTPPTGWSYSNCTITAVSGGRKGGNCLQISDTTTSIQTAWYPIVTEMGKSYIATAYFKSGINGAENAQLIADDGVAVLATTGSITTTDDWVKYTIRFRATGELTSINCQRNDASTGTMLFDEVECYENLVANGEDFAGGDGNCVALYDFESAAFLTDSKLTNDLYAATSTPTLCTTDSMTGFACADFELDNTQYLYRNDADLSAGFPFKSGTTNDKISICAWIKPESFATGGNVNTIVSKYNTGSNRRSFTLRLYEETSGDNRLELVIGYNNGASYERLQHEYGLTTNTWYHVTATFDNDDMSYSLRLKSENGTTLGSDVEDTALHTISFTTEPFRIGAQFNYSSVYAGSRFDGLIDDVIIFKDIITEDESSSIALGTYDAAGDVTGWNTTDCTIASAAGGKSGNCLELTSTGGTYQYIYQNLDLEIGKSYRLITNVKSGTAGDKDYFFGCADVATGTAYVTNGTGISSPSWVANTITFIATDIESYVYFAKNTSHAANPGTMLFDEITLEELELVDEGTYALSDVIDLEGVYTARISASLTTSATNLYDNLYDYGNLYDVTNLYGVSTGQCGINLEVRTTSDDPDATPTWSDWKQVIVGDFTARAFQFRLRFWTNDIDVTPILTAVNIYADLADRTEGFTQEINATEETVTFAFPFYATPSLSLSMVNAAAGTFYILNNQTRTNFTIDVKNSEGTSITKTITGVAKGYGLQEI